MLNIKTMTGKKLKVNYYQSIKGSVVYSNSNNTL